VNAKWWFVVPLLVLVGVGAYQMVPVKVKSGTITTCSDCTKETSRNVNEVSVPRWQAGRYEVKALSGMCQICQERIASGYRPDATGE